MNDSGPQNNPPEIANPDPDIDEAKLEAPAESEVLAAETNTPSVKGEAAQFDQGQTLADARAEHQLDEMYRQSFEDSELHDLRKDYTRRLFALTCTWLLFVLLSVALTGTKGAATVLWPFPTPRLVTFSLNLDATACPSCWRFYFELSNNVLIAFITSTTASVVGIFLIVAKWLFPAMPEKRKNGN